MKRALLIVLDSVGIGHAPDAAAYGDEGANTVGHIRERCPELSLAFLDRCGLSLAERLASSPGRQVPASEAPLMSWGCLTEQSAGKDTTTGHWEMAGAPLAEGFATFETFPDQVVEQLESACGVSFLGNYAQSGTVILDELGERHLQTGKPILYTSSDSVLQIAAHEEVIPIDRLYTICLSARRIADQHRIGRVIARPFLGEAGEFQRTPNRKDFSMQPPTTVLNLMTETGVKTTGIGKISDIFAGSGIGESHPTKSNRLGMEKIEELWHESRDSRKDTFLFANLVDFDMLFGHRRDVAGYAAALREFDGWFSRFLTEDDDSDSLVLVTADHGNDPTWSGTDHTRERVPLLVKGIGSPGCLGNRESFADIAATLADFFAIPYGLAGCSFMP